MRQQIVVGQSRRCRLALRGGQRAVGRDVLAPAPGRVGEVEAPRDGATEALRMPLAGRELPEKFVSLVVSMGWSTVYLVTVDERAAGAGWGAPTMRAGMVGAWRELS